MSFTFIFTRCLFLRRSLWLDTYKSKDIFMSDNSFSVAAICQEAVGMVRANLLAIVIACIPLIVFTRYLLLNIKEPWFKDRKNLTFRTLVPASS